MKTIPAFWGRGEVSQIVLLYMDEQSSKLSSSGSGISKLNKSLAKKIPPKNLVPALLEMWDPLQGSKNLVSSDNRFLNFRQPAQPSPEYAVSLMSSRAPCNTQIEQ